MLMKMLFFIFIVGSLFKFFWLVELEKFWLLWKLWDEVLFEGKQDVLCLLLQEQQYVGIDIVSDGEQICQYFVIIFIEYFSGVDFEKCEIVCICNCYDVSVLIVVGVVSCFRLVFVEDVKFLCCQIMQLIKWVLFGLMMMIDMLYDVYYRSCEKLVWEFVKIFNEEVKELEVVGVDIIQFDELVFNVFFDEVNDWGVVVLECVIEGLKCEMVVYICYGYGIKVNIDWKQILGLEWCQYEELFLKLQIFSFDIILLECYNFYVLIDLIELVCGKKVMVGVIDVVFNMVELVEDVVNMLCRVLQFVDVDKFYLSINCGMVLLVCDVVRGKLCVFSVGVRIVCEEFLVQF